MSDTGAASDVAVMGAGIMGCCLALELAQRGRRVDLYDLAPRPMTGASLHNEGKLHLGFVYAKDPLKESHSLMLRGSLSFSRILRKLTGAGADILEPSQPFYYFVPVDSQLDMTAVSDHFAAVDTAAQALSRATGDLYLDRRIARYWERTSLADHNALFSPRHTLGSFRTEERSVSTAAAAAVICRAVNDQTRIRFMGGTRILSAARLSDGMVEIEARHNGEILRRRYPCAANCLWDDKLRVDATAGVPDRGPWILRYKATINISAPAAADKPIPSATGILGAYGDIVNHNHGTFYVSWYPGCKLAQSCDNDGRRLHDQVHTWFLPRWIKRLTANHPAAAEAVTSITHRHFVATNIRAMAAYVPALACLLRVPRRCKLGGGVILARGATDIDDPDSYLHQRSVIGPRAYGSYVTVDTGKYCTAPLFALQTADLMECML